MTILGFAILAAATVLALIPLPATMAAAIAIFYSGYIFGREKSQRLGQAGRSTNKSRLPRNERTGVTFQ